MRDGNGLNPTFSEEEYLARRNNVRAEMSKRGVDLLYVTSPPNILYLVGYETVWYWCSNPIGVAIRSDSEEVLFFDSHYHRELATEIVFADDSVFYPNDLPYDERSARTVVDVLRSRGWISGTVGLEWWGWTPSAVILKELEAGFVSAGAKVVDGSWTVDHVRLFKSPREIEYMKQAAVIADHAMAAMKEVIRPGVTELEVAAEMNAAMAREGGELPAIRIEVLAGPRAWRFHAAPTRSPIQQGDVVLIDMCGVFNRYHAKLSRTFSLGENRHISGIIDRGKNCVLEVKKGIKPGMPVSEAARVANAYLEEVGLLKHTWFYRGYSIGIGIQPEWVGHVFLSPVKGFEDVSFLPGYTSIFSNTLYDVEENWAAFYIDTIHMMEDGLEVLSSLPRDLMVIE